MPSHLSSPRPVRTYSGRGIGRPRLIPQASRNTNPREDILEAAGRLFCKQGYEETSTREIALAVGLQQGSLFHYFGRKQDMLAELLDRTLQPAAGLLDWLAAITAPPDVKLYLLIRADARNICSQPYNLGSLMFQPAVKSPEFRFFWEKRTRLRSGYQQLLKTGKKHGVFAFRDIELATNLVFGLVESAFIWFTDDLTAAADEVSEELAAGALRLVLARGSAGGVRRRAAATLAKLADGGQHSTRHPQPG